MCAISNSIFQQHTIHYYYAYNAMSANPIAPAAIDPRPLGLPLGPGPGGSGGPLGDSHPPGHTWQDVILKCCKGNY